MCQGLKYRRTICKCCNEPTSRYEFVGPSWEMYKKGYQCMGGKRTCKNYRFEDEVESRHRCATCLAKSVLRIHSGHGHAYGSSSGGGASSSGGSVYGFTTGSSSTDDWYANATRDDGERRLRYSSDNSWN